MCVFVRYSQNEYNEICIDNPEIMNAECLEFNLPANNLLTMIINVIYIVYSV